MLEYDKIDISEEIDFRYMTKDDVINIMNGSNLADKGVVL